MQNHDIVGRGSGEVPRWLQPLDRRCSEVLDVRIDPALGVDADTAYLLECDAHGLIAEVTPFMTSNYDVVLAAEVIVTEIDGPTRRAPRMTRLPSLPAARSTGASAATTT